MKKLRVKNTFLEYLKKRPNVQIACEKSDLSRNTVYRWRKEDLEFAKLMDEALNEGDQFECDMVENQLLTLIKEKKWQPTRFWLERRHPKFKDGGKLSPEAEILSQKEKEHEAFRLLLETEVPVRSGSQLEKHLLENQKKEGELNKTVPPDG